MSVVTLQLSLCLLSLITMTSSLSASDVIEHMIASQIQKMFRGMKDYIATTSTTGELKKTCETMTRKLSHREDDRAMYGCPENFREYVTTPTAILFSKF